MCPNTASLRNELQKGAHVCTSLKGVLSTFQEWRPLGALARISPRRKILPIPLATEKLLLSLVSCPCLKRPAVP